MRDLLARFEPIGADCEFGAVLHARHADRPALFKRGGLPLRSLISALEQRMAGFADPEQVRISEAPKQQYRLQELKYGLVHFIGVRRDGSSPEAVRERECKYWRFLADKLLEDLESAEKIFVYKQARPFNDSEIAALFRALRVYGPNSLLCVEPARDRHPAGSVERLENGLMRGYLDRFLDYDLGPDPVAHIIDGWTSVCREALRIQSDQLLAA